MTFKLSEDVREPNEDEKFDFHKFATEQMKRVDTPKFGKDEENADLRKGDDQDTVFELLDRDKFIDFLSNRSVA